MYECIIVESIKNRFSLLLQKHLQLLFMSTISKGSGLFHSESEAKDRSTLNDENDLNFLPDESTMPHHQVPNFAAILPDYTNMEQDYIRQAFSRTSFVSVRDLPSTFKPSATARAMANKMNANRRSVANVDASAVNHRHSLAAREGVFSTFDYIPSRYSLADELRTKDRLESEARAPHRERVASSV